MNYRYLADQLVVWICVDAESSISRDSLRDFTYKTCNEIWLNNNHRVCKSIKINSVDHPDITISNNLEEAIKKSEVILFYNDSNPRLCLQKFKNFLILL